MTSHRGLSAVIGTVFLVAIVVGALSYISYSLDVMGNFSESLIAEETRLKDKQSEAFEITSISVTAANKLDGIVKNTGEIPLRITTLYIDQQNVNDVVQKFTINQDISPGNIINLIDSIDYNIDPTKGYNLKLVSSRGEVKTVYINSASSESVMMNIRAVPEFVPSEFTTTVLFSVINNMSNNNVLYNVSPILNIEDLVGVDVGIIRTGPNPASYPVLSPGDVAVFEYSVQLKGEVNDQALFNGTIQNSVQGNYVTTTATVREVTVATQAGAALESFGLSTELSNELDVLFFHDEADLTPNGEYHMDGSDPSGGGTTATLSTTPIKFMTANMTVPIVAQNGTWNISFPYYNGLVPPGVSPPSFAFMMICDNCPSGGDTYDSTGNINNDDFEETGNPIFSTSGGPDDKPYFSYDGNDQHHSEWDGGQYSAYQYIGGDPATTAVWFRIPSTTSDYMPIVRWGDENDGSDDEYEIALGAKTAGTHGDVVFRYATDIDNDETRCITDGSYDYDDGLWHLAVGVRPADDDCELYVDGVLVDGIPECINGPCSGTSSVDLDNDPDDVFIGHDGESAYLIGDVAMVMHWDNDFLTASEVLELYNTNYGVNATRAQIVIERLNNAGASVETLYSGEYSFNFHDVSSSPSSTNERVDHYYNDNDYKKYTHGNFTMTTLANSTFAVNDRLQLQLSWNGATQNLPFSFRFDDDDSNFGSLPLGPAYMQTSDTNYKWPTFLNIDRNQKVTYLVTNPGPNGVWFNYQGTRFVLTTFDAQDSYGSLVDKINATSVNEDQDSIYFAAGETAEIEFHIPGNPPQINTPGANRTPVGQYTAAVFLSGYDDRGEAFLRTINLGAVQVYE